MIRSGTGESIVIIDPTEVETANHAGRVTGYANKRECRGAQPASQTHNARTSEEKRARHAVPLQHQKRFGRPHGAAPTILKDPVAYEEGAFNVDAGRENVPLSGG
jgi:hypothetical protein